MMRIKAAAAAAIVTIALAFLLHSRSPADELIAASERADHRPVAGRLAGFPYRPQTRAVRGSVVPDLTLQAAAIRVAAQAKENDRVAVLAHLLLSNDLSGTVRRLSELAGRSPNDPATWSDLSAVRHALGVYRADPHEFALALAAADRALALNRMMPEAAFNRGLALQSLGLHECAVRAYRQALAIEPDSQWADEAREHVKEVSAAVTPVSEPGGFADAIRAHRFEDGRRLVRAQPQLTRQWVETETLGIWGKEFLAGNLDAANQELEIARFAAAELLQAGGDPMLHELVTALELAAPAVKRELADAHAAYREGRLAFRDRKVAEAMQLLHTSAGKFERANSVMAYVARCFEAGLLNDAHESRQALAIVMNQQEIVPERFRALRAHLYWQEGTIRGTLGMVVESRGAYRRSGELFQQLRESVNAATVQQMAASGDFLLGSGSAAWTALSAAFRELGTKDPDEFQRALTGAARGEIIHQDWDVARSLIDVAVELELLGINPRREAYLWTQRAAASLHLGVGIADRDIERAATAAKLIAAPALRDAALFDIRAMEAEIALRTDPLRADAKLSANIEWASAHDYRLRIPSQYIARSRARLVMANVDGATADLESALGMIETRSVELDAHSRSAMLSALDAVMDELAMKLVERGDTDAAFSLVERANDAIASTPAMPPGTTQAALRNLPPGHLVLHYRSLPEALLIFAGDRTGLTVERVEIRPEEVEQAIGEWNESISRGNLEESRQRAEAVYRLLIAPVAQRLSAVRTLAVVPDGVIARAPLAALRDPLSKRFLIERTAIVYSRSTRRYVAAVAAEQGDLAPPNAIVVGDPAFDTTRIELPRLPGAAAESREVASIYGTGAVAGADATARKILEMLPKATIFHFAGHALLHPTDGRNSSLFLAPEGSSTGVLYLRDVEASHLANIRVAVLAACTTAAPTTDRRAISLATAFLSAGVRSAVGTVWDVDDGVTRQFSLRLHQQLSNRVPVAIAMQTAQLQLLESDLRVWAGFQLWKG